MGTLDDTALHRPGRHVRPEVRRRDARPLSAALDREAGGVTDRDELERERREFELMAARENAARRRELMLRKAAIPATWKDATFADLERDERTSAIEGAERWARGELRGLLLWGLYGRGKTRIAATAALERVKRGPVRWLNIADLVMDLRGGFSSPRYEAARQALVPVPGCALVLDDLDKLKPTDHAVQPIYLAINAFVEAELPLLVTLNRDLDDLAVDFGERFGEAVSSRLAGYCDVFEIGGRDRRIAS